MNPLTTCFYPTFGDAVRIVCPSCAVQAKLEADHRVLCGQCIPKHLDRRVERLAARCRVCGNKQALSPHQVGRCNRCRGVIFGQGRMSDGPASKWDDVDLWAEIATRHGTVWALNPKHLAAMRTYLTGKRFTGTRLANGDWRARLPRWMKLAKHRSEVLRALRKLEKRFAEVA